MVELEIDGQKISVPEGTMVIEAAEAAGIYIPRFCYHKKLTIVANCRMCLVEVEGMRKPVPACATAVTQEMKVYTTSKAALESQRIVMEFLLINHPLDCPICDQGGECELQDTSMGFGQGRSNYEEVKRAVHSQDIGPLIETEMTRCIQCTRCIRFGEEIAGLPELGVLNRGEHEEISTYVQHFLQSELSGNIIDLCPVGALTDKPYRYSARAWELQEHPSVSPHDCVGTNLFIHTRRHANQPQRTVMRAVPRENNAINETWMSDRDRFSNKGLMHADRITKPMMKKADRWVEVEWQRALLEIADRTQAIVQQQDANQIAALASASSTVEEFYLLQKMLRALGSHHIDHRLQQADFSTQDNVGAFPGINIPLSDIDELNAILLVGSDVRTEQPLFCHHINMASQEEATVMTINPADFRLTCKTDIAIKTPDCLMGVLEVAVALAEITQEKLPVPLNIQPSEAAIKIAQQLQQAEKSAIFMGHFALSHPQAGQISAWVDWMASVVNASSGHLTPGANTAGAWLAGAVPHRGAGALKTDRVGLDAKALFTTDPVRAYFLLGVEVEFDSAYSASALAALKQAGLVVCLSAFATEKMQSYADFILPIAPFTETAGTYVNVEGTWQSFAAASLPQGDAKPAWKVLRALANFLELEGFHYKTAHAVRDELRQQVDKMPDNIAQAYSFEPIKNLENKAGLYCIAATPMYRIDSLVRRAKPLQEMVEVEQWACVRMNVKTADKMRFQNGDSILVSQAGCSICLPLLIDERLADNLAFIANGLEQTIGLDMGMDNFQLQKEAT